MKNFKLIVACACILFLILLVLQNTQEVVTKLLMAEVRMPTSVLLLTTFALGFVLGVVVTMRAGKKKGAAAKA
jgi:uncharacterized integral membrane protein